MLERYQLGDVLGDIRRELDEIVAEERAGVERRLDERRRSAAAAEPPATRADGEEPSTRTCGRCSATRPRSGSTSSTSLPPDVGDRIRGLEEYDFMEPNARERFDELVEKLRKQVLDQFVGGMSEAIQSTTPGGPRRQPRDGPRPQPAPPRADRRPRSRTSREFLAKHGPFFPGAQTLDDIIDQLAQRMAAMQSLLRSMSPSSGPSSSR